MQVTELLVRFRYSLNVRKEPFHWRNNAESEDAYADDAGKRCCKTRQVELAFLCGLAEAGQLRDEQEYSCDGSNFAVLNENRSVGCGCFRDRNAAGRGCFYQHNGAKDDGCRAARKK